MHSLGSVFTQLLEMGLVMQSKLSVLRSLGVILAVTIYCRLFGCQELCCILFLPKQLCDRYYYYPHSVDEETETQKE